MQPDSRSSFPETSWARLRPGEAADANGRAAAFRVLAEGYLAPTVAFLRHALGRSESDAKDLAHDFFLWVLESGFLSKADPARGPFRGFLKTALRRYVIDADRARAALRRGGGRSGSSLDATDGPEPIATDKSPEEAFDDTWRAEVLGRALSSTKVEMEASGNGAAYLLFEEWLAAVDETFDHQAAAARHGITRIDVSNRLARAKARLRAHVMNIVRESTSSPLDLDQELRRLLGGDR